MSPHPPRPTRADTLFPYTTLFLSPYLGWPRGRVPAGFVGPRFSLGGRAALRDLHAVVGFWVSGLALLLLTTALPWTDVWARGLQTVRFEMGWIQGPQQWKGGAEPLAVQDRKSTRLNSSH